MNKLNLDDLDIKGTYIKEYVLFNKPISEEINIVFAYTYTYTYTYSLITNIDYSNNSYFSYIGIVNDDNVNNYVTPYLDNRSKLNMDEDIHSNIEDINNQLSIIEDHIRNGIGLQSNNIKTTFNEQIDNNKKGVALNYSKDEGYYTEELLDDIRKKLLDEYSYRYITENNNELHTKIQENIQLNNTDE